VVPAVAVLDWVLVGSGPAGQTAASTVTRIVQAWWVPLTFLILPISYLGVYVNARTSSGRPLYPFLNPAAGNFWQWIVILMAVFLAIGYLVWGIGRARSAPARGLSG